MIVPMHVIRYLWTLNFIFFALPWLHGDRLETAVTNAQGTHEKNYMELSTSEFRDEGKSESISGHPAAGLLLYSCCMHRYIFQRLIIAFLSFYLCAITHS